MLSIKNSWANLANRNSSELFTDPRNRRYLIGAAAIWFFSCLLWGAPASFMAALLKPLAPQLDMQILEGGFWRGRAGEVYWRQNDQRIALGSVEWQLSPWSLLWLHPSAHVSATYGPQFVDARVRLSPLGNIQLRDVRAALPVGALAHWLPVPADGLLGLKLTRADVARRDWQLRELAGELQWQQAAWQWSSRWVTLGDYRCLLTMKDGAALDIALQGEGALAASGGAQVNLREKNYALQLQLTPAATLPQEFREGAGALLGERDVQGRWQIKRNGKW
jgi:hypothetical protein